jgi:hypothetical protein
MFKIIVAIIIVAGIAYGDDPCSEGFQTKKGDFWYVCQKGKQMPIACTNSDGDRIDVGSSYQSEKFVFQCSSTGSDIKLTPVACISQGRRVEVGDSFTTDQTQFFKCSKQSDGTLSLDSAGCVGSDGKSLKDGDTVIRGNTAFTCSSSKKGVTLVPKACVFESKQYPVDTVIESFGVWYKCEKSSADLVVNLKGCIDNKTRYEIGKKWNDGYFVFECQKQAGSCLRVGVGCVERYPNGTVTEYKPGDKWLTAQSGDASNRYLITCKKEGLTIKRQGIACFYQTKDGSGYLSGGCMKKVGSILIQCAAPTAEIANVRIRITENPTAADDKRLADAGMKYCDNIKP